MPNKSLFLLPALALHAGLVLGTTNEQAPDRYERVIPLREEPRKELPQIGECADDAAIAAYHRPAQSGVLTHCNEPLIEAPAGRRIPVSVRSAP